MPDQSEGLFWSAVALYTDWQFWILMAITTIAFLAGWWMTESHPGWGYYFGLLVGFDIHWVANKFTDRYGKPGSGGD